MSLVVVWAYPSKNPILRKKCRTLQNVISSFRDQAFVSKGGRGSSAVERATPGEEDPGSIPAVAARSLLVGSVSV